MCRLFGVSTSGRCVGSLGLQDLPERWLWSSGRVFPPFSPLSRFVFGALLANMALFRVLRAFLARFWCCCVGLCGLWALRGLCGFCTRVELGGFGACGVFAFLFVLFVLLLSFCSCVSVSALLCLSSCIVFVALWVWLLFPFPFRTTRKKKGRAVLVRPLSSCCWCVVLDVLKHYRYFLRFIVPISNPFTGNSYNIFGLVYWVVYYLPVFVNG